MLNVCLQLAYNGKRYHGFQRQTQTTSTIQGIIESKLHLIFQRPTPIIASGRTDAGVHANGQVVNFCLEKLPFPVQKLSMILNRLLPDDIHIHKSYLVDLDFHSRFSAKVRMYRYQIIHSQKNAFDVAISSFPQEQTIRYSDIPFICVLNQSINIEEYQSYLQLFVGEKDFTTFCSVRDESNNKTRKIFKIDIYGYKQKIIIDIYANGFLRSMIRSIMGNSLDCYNKKTPQYIQTLLEAKDPHLAKKRLPANGLCLYKVFYSKVW